ncbi:MAG: hypothetical protein DYG89_44715 [Caldilinea sp. CFX5]|nr:hypothetical protein [Caldilinea sp. CFX5]
MKNTANGMNKVNGGVVKQVLSLSGATADRIAVVGVWSGGEWNRQEQSWLQQFREGIPFGQWRVVGVTLISGRDAILQLALPAARPLPVAGDILVFGPGSFTLLDIWLTDLPIWRDQAVEVGDQHYHGVALTENGVVRRIVVFHHKSTRLLPEMVQCVWWQSRPYRIETMQPAVI